MFSQNMLNDEFSQAYMLHIINKEPDITKLIDFWLSQMKMYLLPITHSYDFKSATMDEQNPFLSPIQDHDYRRAIGPPIMLRACRMKTIIF